MLDESILISQLIEGDEQAFEQLYKLHARTLFAFCYQYCKSRAQAEDIVEDTFVWLWKTHEHLLPQPTLKNLLFLRTKHFIINAYRKNVNSLVFEDYLRYTGRASQDSASDYVEFDEFYARLMAELQKLPKTQQRVVEMSKLQQMKNKEIAAELGLSEQTVKNQLSLGLKSLKKKLIDKPYIYAILIFQLF